MHCRDPEVLSLNVSNQTSALFSDKSVLNLGVFKLYRVR